MPRVERAGLISRQYLRQQRDMHSRGGYGKSGHKWANETRWQAGRLNARTILDYGSGQGRLRQALPDLLIAEYDPAIPGKDMPPEPADLVVCGDVLEHVEPECVEAVLSDLRRLANKAVLVIVSTRPAMKNLPDGRNAHVSLHDADWWRAEIEKQGFRIEELRCKGKEWSALLFPRRAMPDATTAT